jgi:hypothetical protein
MAEEEKAGSRKFMENWVDFRPRYKRPKK